MDHIIPLGLDISDLKLRLVQLQKNFKKIKIISFGEISVPEGYIVNGLIKEKDKVAELIKKLKSEVQGRRIFQKRVIACLPEKQSFLKVELLKDTLPETITQAMKKDLPFALEEVYFDSHILHQQKDYTIMAMGACKKQIVDSYLETLDKAGLIPEVLEIEAEAIARTLLPPKTTEPTLIIDLGHARTTLIIFFDNSVQFTTSFNSVINSTGLDLMQLTGYIEQIINFYTGHLEKHEQVLKNILLCGSGAYTPQVIETLTQKIEIKINLGNPWTQFAPTNFQKKVTHPLAYTTALGLALRSALFINYI